MPRRKTTFLIELLLAVLLVAAGVIVLADSDDDKGAGRRLGGQDRSFHTDDPIERGCDLDKKILARIWRGFDPQHSEDITHVPLPPNYVGSFNIVSHTGPWNYVQNVPLILYGPGFIRSAGSLDRAANITDVYSTVGRLTGVDLEGRDGRVLEEALVPEAQPPRLVLVMVWDGAGRNVLERWPNTWPTIARLEKEGTSYTRAVVGSSPSITPATHSSLGAGVFPRRHGVTAIKYRTNEGDVRSAFPKASPEDLQISTFADEIDAALGNQPKVGLLAWTFWQLGMLGHGLGTPGGDADQAGFIRFGGKVVSNAEFFDMPGYLNGFPGLGEHAEDVDRIDGKVDDKWLGHELLDSHANPTWVRYERDMLLAFLEREGYGRDSVTDLFFTNFKMTDLVGHQYTMDSEEMRQILSEQDDALAQILEYLDDEVGDYVVIITADHGHTPSPKKTGAWPVLEGELTADIDRHFDTPEGRSLIQVTSAAGPFLDEAMLKEMDVTPEQIAEFMNSYTIRENWKEDDLPEGFEDRGDEPIFAAAFSQQQLDDVVSCAFGGPEPPSDVGG